MYWVTLLDCGPDNGRNPIIIHYMYANCSWLLTGYGGLSLSIEGPSKADIDCKDKPDGTCAVSYKPTQPGTYVIAIKFAEEHVPGMCTQSNIV